MINYKKEVDEEEAISPSFNKTVEISVYAPIEDFLQVATSTSVDHIVFSSDNSFYDDEYYVALTNKIVSLARLNKNITVTFPVVNRSLFNQYGILNMANDKLKYEIKSFHASYSVEEYLAEEEYLNSLIEEYKSDKYSPFEKYIGIYNIVKNYKPYYYDRNNYERCAILKYVLHNDCMVCVGYADLFIALLDKVGIQAVEYLTRVGEMEYPFEGTTVDYPIDLDGHCRVFLYLEDKKYDIKGFYISDPTWDNSGIDDLYTNLILTFDSMQAASTMFTLEDYDLLFDVHNFKEYYEKLNYLLTKLETKDKDKLKFNTGEDCTSYEYLFQYITTLIALLDKNKFAEIEKKYFDILYDKVDDNLYNEFFTDIGYYIIERTNKQISIPKRVAATMVERNLREHLSKKDFEKEMQYLNNSMLAGDLTHFPYELDGDYNSQRLKDKVL